MREPREESTNIAFPATEEFCLLRGARVPTVIKQGRRWQGGLEREAARSQPRLEERQLRKEEKMPERNVILSTALQNFVSLISLQSPPIYLLVLFLL